MKELTPVKKGSETEKLLSEAFAGEAKAVVRYLVAASVAKKEGFEQIAAIFEESAKNELEHAKIIMKLLNEKPKSTEEALAKAINGEHHEWSRMYPDIKVVAQKEAEKDVTNFLEKVAEVELQHETRFKKLLENIKSKRVFKKDKVVKWKCRNCGYVLASREAPDQCPNCLHPKSYFELFCENY
ncbi:MAG: rubrerythrin family protein [Candidatus Pacearchaeota archaeon]|nr:rubrerythrin family protein [Candidatus Pacearchaeota archaeon]